MPVARNGEVDLAYEVDGPAGGSPILLLCGNFTQVLHWPEELLDGLRARGFRVARFDNRDSGQSTHGKSGYTLDDMADDAVAVLDALGWSSAHLFGPSLGGMIGQVMAVRHPARVRSLTSISSAPGWGFKFSKPKLGTVIRILATSMRGGKGKQASVERTVRVFRLMTTPQYPVDERQLREIAARAYDVDPDPAGGMRQQKAAKLSGDRRADLAKVWVPTLVVHGAADPVQSVSAGRMTAAAIPGARLVVLPDVGHVLPPQVWPTVLDEVCAMLDKPEQLR